MQVITVIESLWAWLTIRGMTKRVMTAPDGTITTAGLDRQDLERIVHALLDSVVSEFTMATDWDFACDEGTITTVANQADYTMTGNNDDCRDVINIRYDTDLIVLDRLNTLSNDRRKPSKSGMGVYGWTWFSQSEDGFPLITIHNTPTDAKTIKYRYRKKGLTIENVPDFFDYVMVTMMKSRFDDNYAIGAGATLREAVHKYRGGSDDYETVRCDPVIEQGNIRRFQNQGGA